MRFCKPWPRTCCHRPGTLGVTARTHGRVHASDGVAGVALAGARRWNRSESVTVQTLGLAGWESLTITRPRDVLALDHVSFAPLFRALSVPMVMALVVSLLLERRVILVSASLSVLSECTHASLALLYPFEWHLVLIPILPKKLIEFCCSPTPFFVGVLADSLPAVLKLPLSEVRGLPGQTRRCASANAWLALTQVRLGR